MRVEDQVQIEFFWYPMT